MLSLSGLQVKKKTIDKGNKIGFPPLDNPILPLFYTASPEEIEKKRYPFLLQLHFLNTRFKAIKQALVHNRKGLADNMMSELAELPKKAPDLMVYLKASFETVMYRSELDIV